MLDRQCRARKKRQRDSPEKYVAQAAAQRPGMRAAAHALAVRREDQRLDAGKVGLVHDVGEAVLQPLVRKARRDLADEAAGVGVAGLHAEPPASAHVVAIGLLGEQPLDEARAGLERRRRLEQRRDVDDAPRRRTAWRRTPRSGSSPGSRTRR